MCRTAIIGADDAQAADQHCQFRRSQAEKLGAVQQQLFGADNIVLLDPVAETIRQRL